MMQLNSKTKEVGGWGRWGGSPGRAVSLVMSLLIASSAMGRDFRVSQLPNGNRLGCGACHNSSGGGGPRNSFGQAVQAITGSANRAFWSATLAAEDSDGDGFSNGVEVGDPEGDRSVITGWVPTNPGNANSKPAVNQAPQVQIASPANGTSFPSTAPVTITATASDTDGTVIKVEFLDGGQVIGEDTTAPFSLEATLAPGDHVLSVKATDDDGSSTTSASVTITVTAPQNTAPAVVVTEPSAGATLTAPALAAVTATASDADGTIAKVEFFSNGRSLGVVTAPPYTLMVDWPLGGHLITAQATDDDGAATTSAEVIMTVNAPEAPTMGALTRNGANTELGWTGGGGPFAVQSKTSMADPWCAVSDVVTNRGMTVSATAAAGFYRVVDLASQGAIPLTAYLSGAFERPNPVTTQGAGTATFKLQGQTLTFDIQYSGLSGPAILAHIHGPAGVDAAAGVMVDLAPFNGGSFETAGTLSGSVVLTAAQKAALLSGKTYVNIHTDANRPGEIRGQILPVVMQAVLNGSNERPNPVSTTGAGRGLFMLTGNQLTFSVSYGGLSGPAIMAHIHGPADAEGTAGVMVDLAPFNGGAFGISGGFAGSVTLTTDQLTALASGRTYVNIHTDANRPGEIRGQIIPCPTAVPLSANLAGDFERPTPVTSTGTGTAILALEGDTLMFNVRYGGLSGAATLAHIHGPADAATAAGVMVDLAPFNGGAFGVSGTLAGSVVLTAEQKAAVLAGRTYVNIHTAANRPGEIRGQVQPALMTASLSGENERPTPVVTGGKGTGHFVVVADRLWFNVTYRGLSGPATLAHIHGPADVNSSTGVLVDLAPFNGGAFGASGSLAGSLSLNPASAAALVDGLTYVNVHTDANKPGEIRGQILRPGNP
ncbi:MAG: CHRD domain-containing protein [Verrucomicrobiales bacterium]|nr:CHRD domain-containing protein [Verrucomicrobiales bacterium]